MYVICKLQDKSLFDFMAHFYELNPRLGSEAEEKALNRYINALKTADLEALVQFLFVSINNLSSLLVRPGVTEESAEVPGRAFEAIASIVHRVQQLNLPMDKHNRNLILASYLQYVFSFPQAQHSAGAFDSKTATLSKHGTSDDDPSQISQTSSSLKKVSHF